MAKKNLSDYFLGSFTQGKCAPKIEGADKVLVILDDLQYYAYTSADEVVDKFLVNLYLEATERESGICGELTACFEPKRVFWVFETNAEISCVEIIRIMN